MDALKLIKESAKYMSKEDLVKYLENILYENESKLNIQKWKWFNNMVIYIPQEHLAQYITDLGMPDVFDVQTRNTFSHKDNNTFSAKFLIDYTYNHWQIHDCIYAFNDDEYLNEFKPEILECLVNNAVTYCIDNKAAKWIKELFASKLFIWHNIDNFKNITSLDDLKLDEGNAYTVKDNLIDKNTVKELLKIYADENNWKSTKGYELWTFD